MKVDRQYVQHADKKQYLQYLKLFKTFREDRTQKYTTLILTFLTMTFFGIFAVNPTLTTIAGLQKTLGDAQFVEDRLTQKVTNLRILGEKYNQISPDLPLIFSAIPETPSVAQLVGELQGLAKETGVSLSTLQMTDIPLATSKVSAPSNQHIAFIIEVAGNYPQISSYLSFLVSLERVLTIDSFSIAKDTQTESGLTLSILGKGYFRKP